MVKHGSALELGLALIQTKLGAAMGDPSFRAFTPTPPEAEAEAEAPAANIAELPRNSEQTRDRSAKVRPPRILSVPT